jgi:hypothetical protein
VAIQPLSLSVVVDSSQNEQRGVRNSRRFDHTGDCFFLVLQSSERTTCICQFHNGITGSMRRSAAPFRHEFIDIDTVFKVVS